MRKIDIHLHPRPPEDDPDMDLYRRVMDENEVEKGLLHAYPRLSPEFPGASNEQVLRLVERHPDRLVGSAYVDLRAPLEDSIATVNRYAARGFRCVKLFPNFGYDPNDERFEPFWQSVEAHGLLCLSHCGWLEHHPDTAAAAKQSLTATPFHFEVPARRHAGINFIFAHFGGGASYLETVTMISRLPNCFADTTPGWGRWVFEQQMPGLRGIDVRKVLYGTDGVRIPSDYARDEAWWAQRFQEQGYPAERLPDFFYHNASRLLDPPTADFGAQS
jgi:predicted TIM-barrel fold metal-dependent hydrolase